MPACLHCAVLLSPSWGIGLAQCVDLVSGAPVSLVDVIGHEPLDLVKRGVALPCSVNSYGIRTSVGSGAGS
jgi:hypothetical protein